MEDDTAAAGDSAMIRELTSRLNAERERVRTLNETLEKMGPERLARECAFFEAFAMAQGEYQPVVKNRTARIVKDSKLLYQFRYADKEAILAATRPALSKNGLSLFQRMRIVDGKAVISTTLAHKGGHRIEDLFPLSVGPEVDPKLFASHVTYFSRYIITELLQVAADDDLDSSDGGGEDADAVPPPPNPELLSELQMAAESGVDVYDKAWKGLTATERASIPFETHMAMKRKAAEAGRGGKQ